MRLQLGFPAAARDLHDRGPARCASLNNFTFAACARRPRRRLCDALREASHLVASTFAAERPAHLSASRLVVTLPIERPSPGCSRGSQTPPGFFSSSISVTCIPSRRIEGGAYPPGKRQVLPVVGSPSADYERRSCSIAATTSEETHGVGAFDHRWS